MDRLEQALTEETARVRAGKLRDAGALSEAKIEFARLYAVEKRAYKSGKGNNLAMDSRCFRPTEQAPQHLSRPATDKSDRACDRSRRVRRHHSRRFGRACAQASAVDLWRQRPGAGTDREGNPASRA